MRALCCIGLSLLLAGGAFSQRSIEDITDDEAAYLKDRLKDPEILKRFLLEDFSDNHSIRLDEIALFKRKFGVADDTLRATLMDIYNSVRHLEGDPFRVYEDPHELTDEKARLSQSIVWFGHCANEPVKKTAAGDSHR